VTVGQGKEKVQVCALKLLTEKKVTGAGKNEVRSGNGETTRSNTPNSRLGESVEDSGFSQLYKKEKVSTTLPARCLANRQQNAGTSVKDRIVAWENVEEISRQKQKIMKTGLPIPEGKLWQSKNDVGGRVLRVPGGKDWSEGEVMDLGQRRESVGGQGRVLVGRRVGEVSIRL